MLKSAVKIFLTITFFAVAMAFLETTVVIYLRMLYYPEGFNFPLKFLDIFVGKIEFIREFATLVMIFTLAWLTGKTKIQKLAAFIYIFAVWDIFYYIFLYLTLGWPSSLFTWDVLFLIPVMWAGPVVAPVINSIMMIVLAFVLLFSEKRNLKRILLGRDWIFLITGSLIVITSYTEGSIDFLMHDYSLGNVIKILYSEELIQKSMLYVPNNFAWSVFIIGIIFHFAAISDIFFRAKK